MKTVLLALMSYKPTKYIYIYIYIYIYDKNFMLKVFLISKIHCTKYKNIIIFSAIEQNKICYGLMT